MAGMTDYLVVVPCIGPHWNLAGFLSTIEPEHLSHFLFIDNSKHKRLFTESITHAGARVIKPEEGNIGVGRAWNIGLREGHEQTVLASASCRFPAGFGKWLAEADEAVTEYGLFTWLQFHLVVIGKATVDKVGLFDENFYPGGWEDNDYCRRMVLAGNLHDGSTPGHVGAGVRRPMSVISVGYSIAMNERLFEDCPTQLKEYFEAKWGGRSSQEKFSTPWGNPDHGLDYWPQHTVEQLRRKYQMQ